MQAPPNSSASPSPSSGEMMRKKYKGVRRRKWGKWVSEIRLPNSRRRIWLGSFSTPEKAARAFDAAFVCLRGPGGGADGLNFPGSPPPSDVGRTSDPDEVRAAAKSHANRASAPPPDDANATDGGALVENAAPAPAPGLAPAAALHVSVPSVDWPNCLPPLYSPTSNYTWSHPYLLPPSSPTAADDVNMIENESGSFPGLWSFDSIGDPVTDQ